MIEIMLVFAFIISAIGLGEVVMRLLPFNTDFSDLERLFNKFILGMGIFIVLVTVLGLFQVLTFVTILIIILLFFLIAVLLNYKSFFSISKSFNYFKTLYITIPLLFIISFNLVRCYIPILDNDSLQAYMAIAKWHAINNGLQNLDFTVWDDVPQSAILLSGIGLILKSDTLSQLLVGWLPGVISIYLVYKTCLQITQNDKVSFIASLLFYTSNTIFWLTETVKPDMIWLMFELSGFLFLFKYVFGNYDKSAKKQILILSAMMFGFALSTKYQTLISFLGIFIVLLYNYRINEKELNRIQYFFKTVVLFYIIAIVFPSIYFIKNIIINGNPLFPLFSSTYSYIGNSMVGGNLFERLINIFIGNNGFISTPILQGQPFGGLILAFIPLGLIFKFEYKPRLYLLLILSILYLVIILNTSSPYPRNIFTILCFLSIISATGVYYLFKKLNKYGFVLIAVIYVAILFNAEVKISQFISHQIEYFNPQITKSDYLNKNLYQKPKHMSFELIEFINKNLSNKDRIASLYYGNAYYINSIIVFDTYLHKPFVYRENDSNIFLEELAKLNIGYVWISNDAFNRLHNNAKRNYKSTLFTNKDFQKKYLIPLYTGNNEMLFKIKNPYQKSH